MILVFQALTDLLEETNENGSKSSISF